MLYQFKSPAASTLIMLEPNGRHILACMGRGDDASLRQGILQPDQMPSAIAALEAAVQHDEAQRAAAQQQANEDGLSPPDSVSLRQRAQPMLDLLKRCQRAGKEMVWGV